MLSLVDPSDFPLRTLPGTVRDLFVNANGAQMLAFDNVRLHIACDLRRSVPDRDR